MADHHPNNDGHWPRAIILVDMNAFFASIEQQDHPEWQGRPIAITNGAQGSCIITCSYEARAYGIHTGMRLKAARRLCPELIQVPSRPERYAAVSSNIMDALSTLTPDVEVFSVDEAFLDVTRCQRLLGPPEVIARRVQATVFEASGLLCSVGVSGDKTTAKYAAKLDKPNGLTLIPPWAAEAALRDVPVTELCGIGRGVGAFLARHGVRTCGQMKHLPISVLARRFGNPGRRFWYMAQGRDPDRVRSNVAAPQSVGHGKVVPPGSRDRELLLTYLLHMGEKVAARLRRHRMRASRFFIGLRLRDRWLGETLQRPAPTNDGRDIHTLSRAVLTRRWHGEGVFQVQVTALDPRQGCEQGDLFAAKSGHHDRVNGVMDRVNAQYGEFTLMPARLLNRSAMPNVIAPSWQPRGHRKTL
ncbi:DNA polymerase IV [Thiohalobacter sp. IOR34]|uniref:DNA polymerase Y family protein n=1 Tax=Thiohalobacter sp. IOR34 TaxID=3057176 RepID=UPI0025B241C0|nr:DNA polymerase IV [Thiohalobacter sp. IOR34]WJW76316.1 DNA polymerase IV [Thiohalobacter sp. IOR34]